MIDGRIVSAEARRNIHNQCLSSNQRARLRPPQKLRTSASEGGERGIRTLGIVTHTTVFETVPLNHSGISPRLEG